MLTVSAGALAAGVPDRGERQRALGVARLRYGRPAGGRLGRQRGPLVRPIRRVHRGGLGHHDPGTAGRAAPVIGDMPVAERAAAGQVGLVRAEQHPARRGPPGQGHRVGERRHRGRDRSATSTGARREWSMSDR